MSEMPDTAAWQQLGDWLRRRRLRLDPRFAGKSGLTTFAEERNIHRRTAWDIEEGKRTNYTRATRREIELAYELPARAIDNFLTAAQAEAEIGDLTPEERDLAVSVLAAANEEGAVVTDPVALRAFVADVIRHRRRIQAPAARDGEHERAAG